MVSDKECESCPLTCFECFVTARRTLSPTVLLMPPPPSPRIIVASCYRGILRPWHPVPVASCYRVILLPCHPATVSPCYRVILLLCHPVTMLRTLWEPVLINPLDDGRMSPTRLEREDRVPHVFSISFLLAHTCIPLKRRIKGRGLPPSLE